MATKVKCKAEGCGHEWDSQAKIENIEAGKVKCKECGETDLENLGPVEPAKPTPPAAKGQEQLQAEADQRRREAVDAKNIADEADRLAAEEAVAGKPLTGEETAFITRIAPMMNKGRHVEKPSPADITRYAKLLKQEASKKVVKKALGDE